jgi:hypothetical protein
VQLECKLPFLKYDGLGFADSFRSSYDKDSPFPKLMNDAIALPLFDGGNVGVRRRHLERIIAAEGYEPWKGMLA